MWQHVLVSLTEQPNLKYNSPALMQVVSIIFVHAICSYEKHNIKLNMPHSRRQEIDLRKEIEVKDYKEDYRQSNQQVACSQQVQFTAIG